MQALGLIETRGLLTAIEGADVMLKTAQVELAGKTLVGGGLVTIAVTGEVGAVKAAVEAGVAAVTKIDPLSLIAQHVIPRPHSDIEGIIVAVTEAAEPVKPVTTIEERAASAQAAPLRLNKAGVDAFVTTFGLEETITVLATLSVLKLRKLTKEYGDLDVAGEAITKMSKDLLIQKLAEYYARGSTK